MKKIIWVTAFVLSLSAVGLWMSSDVDAYPRYNDAGEGGGCSDCHGAFPDATSTKGSIFPSDNKHTMHRSSQNMNTECDLCHTSSDNRNPFIGSSDGTSNNPGLGCTGCHVAEGLRAHHANSGVTLCATCHTDGPATPEDPANVPTYYGTADTNVTDPCNSVAAAQTGENWTIGDFEGTDNDGDGIYDGDEVACPPDNDPGEVAQILVGKQGAGVLRVTYGAQCESSGYTIEWGDLGDVSTYTYAGQECGLTNSGSYDWTIPGNPGLFFMVVGRNSTDEGSYGVGTGPAAGERPEAGAGSQTCSNLAQSLVNRCDAP